MPTRGQVKIVSGKGERCHIYLYQHNDAYDLEKEVAQALAREKRWTTSEFLTRIIFDQMKADPDMERLKTTDPQAYEDKTTIDFGIGNSEHFDIEYLVEVNVPRQQVKIRGGDQIRSLSFREMATLGRQINDCERNGQRWNTESRQCE